HEEIHAIITALGTGISKDDFDAGKLRYHKIILMTDADVDGSHIRTLLLTFFFRHMKELIDRGHIYIAQPPLYRVKRGKTERYIRDETDVARELMKRATEDHVVKAKDGVNLDAARLTSFLLNVQEYKRLRGLTKQIEEFNHPPFTVTRNGTKVSKEKATDVLNYVMEDAKKDFTITRFKGLGEMNAEQLWDTTMNADTRTLLQVKLEDAVAAEDIFTTLMGENVEARRKFIEDNALEVVNLDI